MKTAPTTFRTDNLQIFFQSARASLDAQLVSHLVNFIDGTQESLDCAIYDLRQPDVLAALSRIAQAGKQLRIIYDAGKQRAGGIMADPKPSGTEQAIAEAGLSDFATAVHEGRFLMHNKFLVRDGNTLWTGSANFTTGGLNLQDNNCLVISSTDLATQYAADFAMLSQPRHQHSSAKPAGSAPTSVRVGKASITASFSPLMGEAIEQVVVNALTGAKKVRVLSFLISDPGILNALAAFRDDAKFDIKGVLDPHGMRDVTSRSKQDPELFWFTNDPRFVNAPSHAFNPNREQDFMHNKVLIIDEHLVISGSYNFSENAESNDENLLVIDSPAVATAYTHYFDALFHTYSRTSAVSSS